MNRIKIQIKGSEKFVIRLLKNLNIDIYDIKQFQNKTIYVIDSKDLKKIPKNLIIYRSKTFNEVLNNNKEFIFSLILGTIILILLSNIIVSVKIMQTDNKLNKILMKDLYKNGIKPLTIKKQRKSLRNIKEMLLRNYNNDLEWLEI